MSLYDLIENDCGKLGLLYFNFFFHSDNIWHELDVPVGLWMLNLTSWRGVVSAVKEVLLGEVDLHLHSKYVVSKRHVYVNFWFVKKKRNPPVKI